MSGQLSLCCLHFGGKHRHSSGMSIGARCADNRPAKCLHNSLNRVLQTLAYYTATHDHPVSPLSSYHADVRCRCYAASYAQRMHHERSRQLPQHCTLAICIRAQSLCPTLPARLHDRTLPSLHHKGQAHTGHMQFHDISKSFVQFS